jgi:gliding motility-associated lipoprotein GldH
MKETYSKRRSFFCCQICLLIIFSLLGFSCNKPLIHEDGKTFINQNWNRFDILEYKVPLEKQSKPVNIMVVFVHTDEYPNDYIDLNVTLYMPDGGMRTRDYMFSLKDENGGWSGEVKNGLYRAELPVMQSLIINEGAEYRIRIENKLTKFNTPGIEKVGYIIKKSPKQQ